jgi:anthranilate synthase component 1
MQIIKIPFAPYLSPPAVYSAFRSLYGQPCAILESMSFDERNRMSLVVANPVNSVIANKDSFEQIRTALDKALNVNEALNDLNTHSSEKFSLPFNGGLLGFFHYEIFSEIEPKLAEKLLKTPPNPLDEGELKEINHTVFHEFSTFAFFDHQEQTILFFDTQNKNFRLEEILSLSQAYKPTIDEETYKNFAPTNDEIKQNFSTEITAEQHAAKIDIIKEDILAGEIFQAVLSTEFKTEFKGDSLSAYELLRAIEPTTHLYLMEFGEHGTVCGASPEILGSKRDDQVLYRPIAGTRKRGKNKQEDAAMLADMINDPKENMEHDMLLDLGRNDLGRICQPGSVKVLREKYPKHFANVMHLVSDLGGKIRSDMDSVDFFKSIFPAGTLTGAPKIRAIDILSQLEPGRRGIYGGGVGYFSVDDSMELAIAIRTFFRQGDTVTFRVGGGIVADAEPHKEWKEIHNKAKTLMKVFSFLGE